MLELAINRNSQSIRAWVAVDNGNQAAALILEDRHAEELAQIIRRDLDGTTGAFGHLIDLQSVTPIDLHCVLSRLGYQFEVVRGSEMVEEYDPEIPEGAMT